MTSSLDTLTPLEQVVLDKLLSGESEGYRVLQTQIPALRVTERKMTGVGFFTSFSLPDEAPKLPDEASLEISDVGADLNDLEHGAGFVLFIRKGGITVLEGFTYGEHGLVMLVAFICTTMEHRKEDDPNWKKSC